MENSARAVKKRSFKCIILLAKRYEIYNVAKSEGMVLKSYSDDTILPVFYSLPIMQRHGMLRGMVNTGKHALAVRLFEEISFDDIETEPYALARLLSPVIDAYKTDPLTFFERKDIPQEWLPSLSVLLFELS